MSDFASRTGGDFRFLFHRKILISLKIEDPELELALIPDHSVLINTVFISDCGRIFQDLEMAIKSSIGPRRSAVSSAPDRWRKIKRKNSDNDEENQLSSVFPLRFLFFDRIVLNV